MNALILMTRIPIPGQTKTRLMDTLTKDECAELHRAFLSDLMVTFEHLKTEMDIFVTYTPDDALHELDGIVPHDIVKFPQRGENLGVRMHHAIADVLAKGYECVVLIGSDIPHIQADDIKSAFDLLNSHDIVLGPTYDGGYYLVGMKAETEAIFNINNKWGGKSVLQSTIEIAKEQDLSAGFAAKYRDIDTKDDLFEFMRQIEQGGSDIAPHTMGYMREWSNKRWIKTN